MIINNILSLVQGLINVVLSPLNVVNIGVDFLLSIPIVTEFLQIAGYLLPLNNIAPLFGIVIAIFIFRGALALIRLIWSFIPIIGN